MNLKEQEYVCALAENGTITAAAKELFISQPASKKVVCKIYVYRRTIYFRNRTGAGG